MTKFSFRDATKVRDHMNMAIQVALQEALQTPLHVKVLVNNVTHDALQPSGDLFDIKVRVEVHPKKEEPTPDDVPSQP